MLGGGGATVVAACRDLLDRFVAGQDPVPPPALWRRLAGSLNRLGRGTGYLAIAAIDLAAWDLHARRLGEPLGLALGGEARTLPVYGSGGFGPAQDADAAVARALEYAEIGCTAVKLRAAGNHNDIERMHAVRDALPHGVDIMVDATEKLDLARAKWLANECAEINTLWLEEPLPAGDVNGFRALAATSPVPIATGEHHQGAAELAPLLDARAVAVVQPDLAMMGGITECLRVARLAEHFGIVVSPHFLPALFVHVAAAAPAVRWLEDFPLLEPLFIDLVEIDGTGDMTMPATPGHGMRWAPGAREEYRVEA